MKFAKSLAIAAIVCSQAVVVCSAQANGLGRIGGISLYSALPALATYKLPVLGGTGVADIPLAGSFFGPLTLNQYIATGEDLPALALGARKNLLTAVPALSK